MSENQTIHSVVAYIPSMRGSTLDSKAEETMTTYEVEKMTYELKKAQDSYNETAVLNIIREELRQLEDRFDITFNNLSITLANFRTHNVEHEFLDNSGGTNHTT